MGSRWNHRANEQKAEVKEVEMTTQRREMACSEMLLGPRSAALIFFSLLFSLLFSSLLCVLYVHVHIRRYVHVHICRHVHKPLQFPFGLCPLRPPLNIIDQWLVSRMSPNLFFIVGSSNVICCNGRFYLEHAFGSTVKSAPSYPCRHEKSAILGFSFLTLMLGNPTIYT